MGSSSMCQTQGGEIGTVLDGLTELALQGTAGDPVTVECLPKPLTAGAARACCRRSKRPQYSQPAEPTATSASSPTTRIRRPNRCAPCATRGTQFTPGPTVSEWCQTYGHLPYGEYHGTSWDRAQERYAWRRRLWDRARETT